MRITCISGAVLGNSGYNLHLDSSLTDSRGCKLGGEDSCSGSANTAGPFSPFFTASSQSCSMGPSSSAGREGYSAGALGAFVIWNWVETQGWFHDCVSGICSATSTSAFCAASPPSFSFDSTDGSKVLVDNDVGKDCDGMVCCFSEGWSDCCVAVSGCWTGSCCSSSGSWYGRLRGTSVKPDVEASSHTAGGTVALLSSSACFCFLTDWKHTTTISENKDYPRLTTAVFIMWQKSNYCDGEGVPLSSWPKASRWTDKARAEGLWKVFF